METLKSGLKVVMGFVMIVLGAYVALSCSSWAQAVLDLIKAGIVLGVILVGLAFIIIGVSDLKND
jgi:uncharacterized membrane protein